MNHIHWDRTKIKDALDGFFKRGPKPAIPANGEKYKIQNAFNGLHKYWIHKVDNARFGATVKNGILYRAEIVNELVAEVDKAFTVNEELECGIMVAGPHGVGKSHSLINLVLALQQKGKLVTFIPNCGRWNFPKFMVDMICGSFGTTMDVVGDGSISATDLDVDNLVRIVTDILGELKERWVFVFDQVNVLFTMDRTTKIEGLTAHHRMISDVRSAGRVLPVISASANNEIANDHSSFFTYNHPIELHEAELKLLFPELELDVNESLAQSVQEAAGRHPYYVARYIEDPTSFHDEVYDDVEKSVKSLLKREEKAVVMESIILCVLQRSRFNRGVYDRKFMVPKKSNSGETHFHPVMPAVVAAYRNHHWDDIMAYVEKQERYLLEVCGYSTTTQDVRGRLFESVVIGKIFSTGLDFTWDERTLTIAPGSVYHLGGSKLPDRVKANVLYVPDNPNFTAIDFFARTGNFVVAFQVHTSSHPNVGRTFLGMCCKAGWLKDRSTADLILPNNDDGHLPNNDDGHLPNNDDGHLPNNDDGRLPNNDDGHLPNNDDGHLPNNDDGVGVQGDGDNADYTVLLVYLSPNGASKERVQQHVEEGVIVGPITRSQRTAKRIYVASMCLADLPGSLRTIAYPASAT
jgi:hypothetical protein